MSYFYIKYYFSRGIYVFIDTNHSIYVEGYKIVEILN